MTEEKKIGGRQRKSRVGKLRKHLDEKVEVVFFNTPWEEDFGSVPGTLEFRKDKGYFLVGSNVQIPVKYSRTFDTSNPTEIKMDLRDYLDSTALKVLEEYRRQNLIRD